MIVIAALIIGISTFFIGPDEGITLLKHNIYICIMGLGVFGFNLPYLYYYI